MGSTYVANTYLSTYVCMYAGILQTHVACTIKCGTKVCR